MEQSDREIPYNYTSAVDKQVIEHLFGPEMVRTFEKLRPRRSTGRSARLLNRFMGDMFMIERNPFIFQELVDNPEERRRLFSTFEKDLAVIRENTCDKDVAHVVDRCGEYRKTLFKKIQTASTRQRKITRTLSPVVGKDNIYFDPFSITTHATDATDWRLHLPAAVVRPSSESRVAALVKVMNKSGMKMIPRGGGTGLTGGATPLAGDCIMVNTEKLNRIGPIEQRRNRQGKDVFCVDLEAGVITEDAMKHAKERGLVFATDPTSAWASTIGGNISENAGGKTAVLWGTALDNILSYNMVMPSGRILTIERQEHPGSKIMPEDTVVFNISDEDGHLVQTVTLTGEEIRKPGLGKDVTNKVLKGLPGIQKEGCDGIITSATFILHRAFKLKKTVCIEFFGNDLTEAGKVIRSISTAFRDKEKEPCLIALEHFDDEYIKAIDYKAKAAGTGRLKAVLLLDMVSDDPVLLEEGMARLYQILAPYDRTEATTAKDDREAERFWRDRKRLGAIASRTNAFKLNEDIVLPIDALADFAEYVDRYNIDEKRVTCCSIIDNIMDYLETAEPLEDSEWLKAKVNLAGDMAGIARAAVNNADRDKLEEEIRSNSFVEELLEIMRGYTLVSENIKKIHKQTLSRLIVIATHMHAGDGNVHVNIPVMSNDREMMERAARTADRIMEKAVGFNGVVSGEHGIGITKFRHLPESRIEELEEYRGKVDPDRIMNPFKLSRADIIDKVFTPSFNLLELEANILRRGSLGTLALEIANCVRCGRCKRDCPVFFPGQNLFFHPRNKILAVASLIEALLYITQRTHSTRFRILKYLEEIADHCTTCRKCLEKCPVNIDSGKVSIIEREILAENQFKHTSWITSLTLQYLTSRNRLANRVLRYLIVNTGSRVQRAGSKVLAKLPDINGYKQKKPFILFKTELPVINSRPMHSILPKCEANQAVLAEPSFEPKFNVFYFPGCGSERLFSDIGKASLYLLLKRGARVILPPPFLCCGFPARINASKERFNHISLRDTIILSQIQQMFNDLDFTACVVSCGTCKESLENLDAGTIFNCRIKDVSAFALETEPSVSMDGEFMYHAPCHDSMEGRGEEIIRTGTGADVHAIPYCCSEAGTMAMSRPDITDSMLKRKRSAIDEFRKSRDGVKRILTNCPSCLQGLGRCDSAEIDPVHLSVELAARIGGPRWQLELEDLVRQSTVIQF
ncbi:MAG: DUF3683 domain-containing protein [Desulfarculaceae bacterium]|nr:DUF3683 domain-containing protein [Desulfarculaceae bacterium]